MIKATVKSTGTLINKPRITTILLEDENAIAVRRKNEETNRIEQFTIGELFDSFYKKASYNQNIADQRLFEDWFSQKYISGKNIQNSIISVEFSRVSS
jgi:hypothetical protein